MTSQKNGWSLFARWLNYEKFSSNEDRKLPQIAKEAEELSGKVGIRKDFLSEETKQLINSIEVYVKGSAKERNLMNTALVIIGLSMLIFLVVFYLKRAKEKREAWLEEREKIKEYGEKINEETRNKSKQ